MMMMGVENGKWSTVVIVVGEGRMKVQEEDRN